MKKEKDLFFSQAISAAIEEEMERDESVVLLGEDIGLTGGAFGATRGLWEKFGPRRVVQTPISENSIVGLGIGAAITGLRPVVEIMYMDFIGLAYDQIMNKMSKLYYLTGGEVCVPMVIRVTAGGGRNYGPDHSQSLEALLNHLPGVVVAVPSSPENAKGLLKAAIRCDDPVVFVEYRMNYSLRGKVSQDPEALYPLGKAEVIRSGSALTLISYGRMLNLCKEVIDESYALGEVELIDLLTIKPVDLKTIGASVRKTKNVMIVDEGYRTNGVAAEITALVNDHFFFDLDAPVRRVTGRDLPIPFSGYLEDLVLPNKQKLFEEITLCLQRMN